MDKTTPEKAIKELTMVLIYLSRFNEDGRFSSSVDMSWKGYDFGIINELDDEDHIRLGIIIKKHHSTKGIISSYDIIIDLSRHVEVIVKLEKL